MYLIWHHVFIVSCFVAYVPGCLCICPFSKALCNSVDVADPVFELAPELEAAPEVQLRTPARLQQLINHSSAVDVSVHVCFFYIYFIYSSSSIEHAPIHLDI